LSSSPDEGNTDGLATRRSVSELTDANVPNPGPGSSVTEVNELQVVKTRDAGIVSNEVVHKVEPPSDSCHNCGVPAT